ncbi:hypothetical protein WICANDRAFT_63473 [Wickerhamomyces anomalus NRRL Y-366-8]|uniref:NADH-ubiquinone oxidoreductase B12 subunit n=1 Tax=Wickerhamomyces anomalus (strain ATCC 58044 / CBS 1984 / NCYC 433 / NRRL Y-366-8) TaxID=683960 RepID=A0A1E3P0I2_WICAA|nr:uncharacterized protein WICANDRAFT_63473 [Wickerhamomyces anomalus NRRL Y-366-8]ODQ58969.1 hypothetical protein WICANDRAFT_63473 [Wickerhamomyces anomalus NRRL Y-366-8]
MAVDPFARREAWRYQGHNTRFNRFKNVWPGFFWGVGAFAVYVAAEKVFFPPKSHHEHEDEHH